MFGVDLIPILDTSYTMAKRICVGSGARSWKGMDRMKDRDSLKSTISLGHVNVGVRVDRCAWVDIAGLTGIIGSVSWPRWEDLTGSGSFNLGQRRKPHPAG